MLESLVEIVLTFNHINFLFFPQHYSMNEQFKQMQTVEILTNDYFKILTNANI